MRTIWWLRGAALLLFLFLAFKPVVTRPDPGLPTEWAVLLDSSKSMRVQDPYIRFEKAKVLAADILKQFPRFRLFHFSSSLNEIKRSDLETLEAKGAKTDLAEAIKRVFSENNVRGAVVFSDGRHIGSGDAVAAAAAMGQPLFLVGFGDKNHFKDVAVRSVHAPPFAFKNIQTSLTATVSAFGFPNQNLTVKLKDGDHVLAFQTVHIKSHEFEAPVLFSWTPRSLGSKNLTVEVDAFSGEMTNVNNRKDVTVDVTRDRFRVLYICGEPGPEYAFLRHQFKADPGVELVTFVILRNAFNVVSVPEAELSLIPFPTQDVLISQIATFDLVVFEEFAYQTYGLMQGVLHAIRKKVEDGGSFLLMGGPVAFGEGSNYAVPGIREMIPVEFGSALVQTIPEARPFIPKALEHPILRLEAHPDRNRELWQNLPPLEGITLVPQAKPEATVLGTVNWNGRDHPLLTVWRFGKGRVATLTARTTWRWAMMPGKKEQTADAYQQFWKNMVLWLTHSDQFKNVRMAFENKRVKLDEPEPLRVWVYDEYFKPLSDVEVRVEVTAPDGTSAPLPVHSETSGVYVGQFTGKALGTYKAQAWVLRRGKKYGSDTLTFRVVENYFEEEDLTPDTPHLKELAEATGGKYVKAAEFSPHILREFDNDVSQKSGRKVLLWNSPWLFAVGLILLAVEWTIRKRKGLP